MIDKIITEKLFKNAFGICKKYCTDNRYIQDLNFKLIEKNLKKLNEEEISDYYNKYIRTEVFYCLPELFSTDKVLIPKNTNSLREYSFLSTFSMITYNSVGLFFLSCCNDFINDINSNFISNNIFSYAPSKFRFKDNIWHLEDDYKEEYQKFINKIKERIDIDNLVLKIDIHSYFESIEHKKLIEVISKFSWKSKLISCNFDEDSISDLNFYFESLMGKNLSIPQGRKNFISDYLGYLYLLFFDINVESICKNEFLKFKGMVRYVDDIYIFFSPIETSNKKRIFKEILKIEQSISKFLNENLGLLINNDKTERKYIDSDNDKKDFLNLITKSVSTPDKSKDINKLKDSFLNSLTKFKLDDSFVINISKSDREDFKLVFNNSLKNYLRKRDNKLELISKLKEIDFELLSEYINILITLFLIDDDFKNIFKYFIKNSLDLSDKRHIHIILTALLSYEDINVFKKIILENSNIDTLKNDDYGKYLYTILKEESINNDYNFLSIRESVFEKIKFEFYIQGNFITNNSIYNQILIFLINSNNKNTLIEQLKSFVHCFTNNKWSLSLNHFHSFFDELCKIMLKKEDETSILRDLDKFPLNMDEKVQIRKFYHARNFNKISHPSQDGIPSVNIKKEEVEDFFYKILKITLKITNFFHNNCFEQKSEN